MVSVDAYPFFWLFQTGHVTLRYRNRCFLVALCCMIVRRLNLEIVIKRLFHEEVKIVG